MDYLIGVGLALSVSLLARIAGLDRDRAFYPTVMILIASCYGLFAVMGGSMPALGIHEVPLCQPQRSAHQKSGPGISLGAKGLIG